MIVTGRYDCHRYVVILPRGYSMKITIAIVLTIAIVFLLAGILVAVWFIRTPPPKKISGNPQHISMRQMVSEATADRRHVSIPRRSEDVLRSALSTDKTLATFKLLSDKALRTSEEEHQYSELISDRARLLVTKTTS